MVMRRVPQEVGPLGPERRVPARERIVEPVVGEEQRPERDADQAADAA